MPRRQLELGLAIKGSLAFSQWDLGSPGVYDGMGFYYYPDNISIGANWWAAAALATAHLHVGLDRNAGVNMVLSPMAPAPFPAVHGASTGLQDFLSASFAASQLTWMSESWDRTSSADSV